jgi:GAF domain-containing protein
VVGKVALERKSFLISNIDNEPGFQFTPRFDYASKSFLSVPLEFSGDLIGVINLTDKISGGAFSEEDLRTAQIICKHLGIAIHSLIKYLDKQKELSD